jgi:type IV secretion system protein VirB9
MRTLILLTGLSLCAADAAMAAQAAPRELAPVAAAPVEFPFETRGVYPLVTAPGRITDIALEPGEALVETNPIAAGDTARWVIGDTSSGQGSERRVHVLIKPTLPGISTNLVINTDRRTYFLDVRASKSGFLTQVAWRYPIVAPPVALLGGPLLAAPVAGLVAEPASDAPPPVLGPFHFGYVVSGPKRLKPVQVFDDGARTVVVFGPAVSLADLPPLYRIGLDGKALELVNYHVEDRGLVVDGLLERAELRFGLKRSAARVRITRTSSLTEARP